MSLSLLFQHANLSEAESIVFTGCLICSLAVCTIRGKVGSTRL